MSGPAFAVCSSGLRPSLPQRHQQRSLTLQRSWSWPCNAPVTLLDACNAPDPDPATLPDAATLLVLPLQRWSARLRVRPPRDQECDRAGAAGRVRPRNDPVMRRPDDRFHIPIRIKALAHISIQSTYQSGWKILSTERSIPNSICQFNWQVHASIYIFIYMAD